MSRRDLPEWRHDKPPSASKLNRLTGEVGRLTGLPTSGESYVDNTSGRYPIPRRRSVAKRLSHYRIIAKNCIVDCASLSIGDSAGVFPSQYNGGPSGLENNYVIARPCTEYGMVINEDPEPETGYTDDTVLVCIPVSFRGFVTLNTVIMAQGFAVPDEITTDIGRAVLAVVGGHMDVTGRKVVGNQEVTIYDATEYPTATVDVPYVDVFDDGLADEQLVSLRWELVGGTSAASDQPDSETLPGFRNSRLVVQDYGCPPVPEEE